ncbi:MAG: DPP IV N-terminal domain-containing protein [Bacteroidaceae bacterium]
MKYLVSFLVFFAVCSTHAATRLTLRDITNGTYSAERLSQVKTLADGESYAQISSDGKRIVRYSFKTGTEIGVLFNVETARNKKLSSINGYILSPDESRILIQTKTKPIYRHSFTADYYIYTVKNNTLEPLSEGGPQQAPLFSPNGNLIAFVRHNNLFLVKLLFNNSESQITKDGKTNEVLNGIPDWVNEEEFSTNRTYDFTADSQMLVWVRYDETNVPVYAMPLYKGLAPSKEEYSSYPGSYQYKYPVAGEQNATLTAHSYDIKSHVTRKIDVPLQADGYIPRLKATSDPNKVAILTLNRHQDQMDIYMANPRSTVCRLALREKVDKYVTEKAYTDIQFYNQNFMLFSDRSGYQQLYWYTLDGQLIKQITPGHFDVTNFYGYDAKNGEFYYASREDGTTRKSIYSIDLKGRKKKLSKQLGENNATFSESMKYYLQVYSNMDTPPITSICDNSGKELKVLIDNNVLKNKLVNATSSKKELFTFTTQDGTLLNGWMVKPSHFNANKKYPVIMYQYAGPGSQEVLDSWGSGFLGGMLFESYMAEQDYIFVCVDGRGTGGRGAAFEKCTYLTLGDLESKDQVEAALYLGTLPYVDKTNIGIWGWSFGGFNTLMSMSDERSVFKAGVAVAAPSHWKFYDTVYTERYMRTPKENPTGYAINPIERAAHLSGNLLLCHGTADDNVHYCNATEYSEALVQADKQFDMQIYTNRNHNIAGGNTRYHLFTRIIHFFNTHLK